MLIDNVVINTKSSMSKNIPKINDSFKIHDKSCLQSFVLQEIDEEEISSYIKNIKTSSAPGPDEIPPKFVKFANIILTPTLTMLFNKCIQQEIFPDAFKIAHVILIPKVQSPKSFNELRPISLSVFSKLFEKILVSKMNKFLNKNSILTSPQIGFRTKSSAELAIIKSCITTGFVVLLLI